MVFHIIPIVLAILILDNVEFGTAQLTCPAGTDVSLTCDTQVDAQQRDDCLRIQQMCMTGTPFPSGWIEMCALGNVDARGFLLGTQIGSVKITFDDEDGICVSLCPLVGPCIGDPDPVCFGPPIPDTDFDLCEPDYEGRVTCSVKPVPAPPGPCVEFIADCPWWGVNGKIEFCELKLEVGGTSSFAISMLNGDLVLRVQITQQPTLCITASRDDAPGQGINQCL